ncbi:hypothetical protein NECID01_0300 [Nematocida sp. AWRm77]|nr:hypothetical protein NECID01_0300 [Nematocida sp. AWRm77]
MHVHEVCSEVQDSLRRKNNKKAESLFTGNLKHSHSKELWTLYLQYVQSTSPSKDVLKDAVEFAFKKTYFNVYSADIKIRYIEMLMQTEEKERVAEAYSRILEVPLSKAGMLIEFYRDYEASRSKGHKKALGDLLPKEVAAQTESQKLDAVLQRKEQGESAEACLVEYVLKKHREKHPMFITDVVVYAIDAGIEVSPESPLLYMYKAMMLISEEAFVQPEQIINGFTKAVVLAKGKSEKMIRCSEYLLDALKKTNNSLPVLLALTAYQFIPDSVLGLAPASISEKSEAFYAIFFTALLKHKDVSSVRYYLVKLTKEEKIGHRTYCFCAKIESALGKEKKYVGGILFTGLKLFLGKLKSTEKTSSPFISARENAYRIATDGARILLSLGDVHQAGMLVDLFYKYAETPAHTDAPAPAETNPKLILAEYKVLFESGFLGVSSLFADFSFQEIYAFLCRLYHIGTAPVVEFKVPSAVTQFVSSLPPVRDSHNVCSTVNLDKVVRIIQNIKI